MKQKKTNQLESIVAAAQLIVVLRSLWDTLKQMFLAPFHYFSFKLFNSNTYINSSQGARSPRT